MTILLTNDDGYRSEGLTAIRDGLIGAGLDVIVIAPDGPRSGTSRSATFRRAVNVNLVGGDDRNPVYACDGTPVDCVRVGLMSRLAHHVDLVISGINEGANLGDDSTYSSTVGAAWEGALLGVPSIAASQQSQDGRFRLVDLSGYDWTWSVRATVSLAQFMLAEALPARSVVNLNAPGARVARGVETTRLGRRSWRRGGLDLEFTDAHGHGYYSFEVNSDNDPLFIAERDTDFAALQSERISLTPMSLAWGDDTAVTSLQRWVERAAIAVAADLDLEGPTR